jgi:hypothetical protein
MRQTSAVKIPSAVAARHRSATLACTATAAVVTATCIAFGVSVGVGGCNKSVDALSSDGGVKPDTASGSGGTVSATGGAGERDGGLTGAAGALGTNGSGGTGTGGGTGSGGGGGMTPSGGRGGMTGSGGRGGTSGAGGRGGNSSATGGATAMGGNAGANACAALSALDRSCATAADCVVFPRQSDCCGSTLYTAIRAVDVAAASALEKQCGPSMGACPCCATCSDLSSDDGSRLMSAAEVQVTCANGKCVTFSSACGQPCGSAQSCFSCSDHTSTYVSCATACTQTGNACASGTTCQVGTNGTFCAPSTVACGTK